MKLLPFSWLSIFVLLAWTACNPKIYSYDATPHSISQDEPVTVKWKVKGRGFLLVHDIPYPGGRETPLHDIAVLVKLDGKESLYPLRAVDTMRIPLPVDDSLIIKVQPGDHLQDRLRYLTLVAALHGKELPSTRQIEIRTAGDMDEIAFVPKQIGDSLVAAGENSPERWGDDFVIGTVGTVGDRTLVVSHQNITRIIRPGESPSEAFKDTPVKGFWSISTLMTTEERTGSRRTPSFLKISITINHR